MYDLNEAHSMNWLKAFASVPSNTFDLCVTSPPYYNARKYGAEWDTFKSPEDWLFFCTSMVLTIVEVLRPEGVLWWNTGSGYMGGKRLSVIEKLIVDVEEQGVFMIDKIPWIKTSFLPKKYSNRPYPAWEENIIFSREPSQARYYVDHVREPYAESTLKRLKYPVGNLQADEQGKFTQRKMVTPHPDGKAPANYLKLKVDTTKRDHPAPMAPELANWAIRAYSKEGDYVLDPMCGVGTTLLEAQKLNRIFLGFDVNPEYVEEANRCLTTT